MEGLFKGETYIMRLSFDPTRKRRRRWSFILRLSNVERDEREEGGRRRDSIVTSPLGSKTREE